MDIAAYMQQIFSKLLNSTMDIAAYMQQILYSDHTFCVIPKPALSRLSLPGLFEHT